MNNSDEKTKVIADAMAVIEKTYELDARYAALSDNEKAELPVDLQNFFKKSK